MAELADKKHGESAPTEDGSATQGDNKDPATQSEPAVSAAPASTSELDEFGLPIRPKRSTPTPLDSDSDDEFKDALEDTPKVTSSGVEMKPAEEAAGSLTVESQDVEKGENTKTTEPTESTTPAAIHAQTNPESEKDIKRPLSTSPDTTTNEPPKHDQPEPVAPESPTSLARTNSVTKSVERSNSASKPTHAKSGSVQVASEWSHQQIVTENQKPVEQEEEEDWKEMPAYAPFKIFNDDGKLIADEKEDLDDDDDPYNGLGGAGRGYTRVQLDEDAQSATSMDDHTAYLFKDIGRGTALVEDEEDPRDATSQLQATKDLLTEGQKIAYVGLVRLAMVDMIKKTTGLERTRNAKKFVDKAYEAMAKWSQKITVRLYTHMEISADEQLMIEQLAEHGVQPADLSPALMLNSRVKNPAGDDTASNRDSMALSLPIASSQNSQILSSQPVSPTKPSADGEQSPSPSKEMFAYNGSHPYDNPLPYDSPRPSSSAFSEQPPPPYDEHGETLDDEVRMPSQLPQTKDIDIDIRWTVLCDLFLLLISDSSYDSRSRQLLELVASFLDVTWQDICRFEKRVTDALEMQEEAEKENWNEEEHMSNREKLARKRRYVMMGLATVGGGLVIGLSAGLLAPVIGAGLAAGFTTIGVAGTSGFLAGAGGAAIVTTTGVVSGSVVGLKASHRRTGAVETFEYRPLHNNKRVNLIVTVSGWMTGKVDDVRLPFSTVDPVMGDIYSVLWEPKMLQSMGDTINILATEALTQGLQQVLGATILVALMSAIQLPVVLTKLSYLIDNPWTNSLARADAAGLILADSLIDRNLGSRPITLVGFSLGSRLIFSALRELANKGAFGLVQNVYIFGSPVVVKKDEYIKAKSVVAGRFVNGYVSHDWILGYLFRATGGGIARVAGLAPVELPGIENLNAGPYVSGHMAYRQAMPRLLREVGWSVESDEFTEIEDPDPEDHAKRQRELINEIEEARKELEKKPEKKRFGFFKSKKMAEKKEWEVYDEQTKGPGTPEENTGVLFDIDAIRREAADLAAHGMEVKQLESTLPPMQLDVVDITPRELVSTLPPMKLDLSPALDRTQSSPVVPSQRSQTLSVDGEPSKDGSAPTLGRSTTDDATSKPGPSLADRTNSPSEWPTNGTPDIGKPMAAPVPSDLDHNVWDDDEFGGGEREVKMTFE